MKLHSLIAFIVILLVSVISGPVFSQTGNPQDLSNVRVDELSDGQVRKFLQDVRASGLGEDKIEQIAAARGMIPSEILKLRQRIDRLKLQSTPPVNDKSGRVLTNTGESSKAANTENIIAQNSLDSLSQKIFGASLFANANPTFEPNLRLATPIDYQLGPDDEILIDIYGYSEASYQLKVSPDGTINVPLVGVIPVSGATIEQATSRIRSRLSRIYTGINNGSTSVSITLGNIRSIRVILTGEVKNPGTYTLPSVATVFNALYFSGGPTSNGSFRTIQIIRGTDVIAALDVYDFLLYGTLKNNVRLQDQDVIRIPTYRSRVEISGEVKRPGIFEMKPDESLDDLLRFAGEFTDQAYQARIKVLKNTPTEREIEDVTATQFKSYKPSSGDQYFVNKILDRFANRVTIKGALFREGAFELEKGLTLSGLISKAEGLREDAFLNRGYIVRKKEDLSTEVISFDPAAIVNGTAKDIPLKREDIVTIPSIFDLKEAYKLTIDGEVRAPGVYDFAEGTTLEDLILRAGGFTESATGKRVDISRRIRDKSSLKDTSVTAQIFTINIDQNLKSNVGNFKLEPFDVVIVRSAPGYEIQKNVHVEGEVLYPGNYTITNKNERISDVLNRAGGLTIYAYKQGASLKRITPISTEIEKEQEYIKLRQFEELQRSTSDSQNIIVNDITIRNNYVGIDLESILKRPHRRYDLLLEDGDIINIPKQLQTVKVSGEVLSPTSIIFNPAHNFREYVNRSGGFAPRALKRRSYVVYANGSISSTKKFLFINNYPPVKPGAEIFVPQKVVRKNSLSTSEIIAISTGLATIGALILTSIRLSQP